MRRTTLPLALAALLTLTLAIPINAAIFERETFADAGTDAYTCGDTDFSVWWEVSGRYHMRTGKGPREDAFFEHINFRFHEVHTNLDTGETLTVSGRVLDKEVRGTRVEGTVFEFTRIIAGQHLMIRDSQGKVLLKDAGVIQVRYLFDTLGDDVPGGDFLGEIDVVVRGSFPGLDLGDDPCELWDL